MLLAQVGADRDMHCSCPGSHVPLGRPERLLQHNAAARHGKSDGIPLTRRIAGSDCSDGWTELLRVCHHAGGLMKLQVHGQSALVWCRTAGSPTIPASTRAAHRSVPAAQTNATITPIPPTAPAE